MRKQIAHISVHQTSKVIAAMYAAMVTIMMIIPLVLYTMSRGDFLSGLILLFIMPFFYWLIFYIAHVIGCWFYNIVAKRMGGIEFDLVNPGEIDQDDQD